MRRKLSIRAVVFWLFIIYTIVMMIMLFGRDRSTLNLSYPEQLQYNINIVPFRTIKQYFGLLEQHYLVSNAVINLIGNIAVFIPVGLFLPYLWQRLNSFFRFILTCTLIILIIEAVQLFTLLGRFDVDDLILNILGMSLGFLIYKIICRINRKHKS